MVMAASEKHRLRPGINTVSTGSNRNESINMVVVLKVDSETSEKRSRFFGHSFLTGTHNGNLRQASSFLATTVSFVFICHHHNGDAQDNLVLVSLTLHTHNNTHY
jgi:hypothetical protein